jgi:hypothetical protein
MGRFLSPDPLRGDPAQPQSLNLYAYVRGNPLNAVDPDGRITLAQYHVLQALKDAAFAASSQERFLQPLGRALWEGAKVLLAALQEALADMQRPGADGGDDEGSGVDHAASAVGQLREAQDQAMTNPALQQDKAGHTHCNEATVFVARAVGAPLAPLVDSQGHALPANQMAANLAASPQYRAVSEGEAQALANQGRFVIAAWNNPKGAHGHVATVRPEIQGDRFRQGGRSGPWIANVGRSGRTGVFRRSAVFPKGADVRYYTPVE